MLVLPHPCLFTSRDVSCESNSSPMMPPRMTFTEVDCRDFPVLARSPSVNTLTSTDGISHGVTVQWRSQAHLLQRDSTTRSP
jgi:hypothetical protein